MDILREQIINSLKGGHAFISVEKALEGIDPDKRNLRPNENLHSIWEELEHLRLAQKDLLYYMIDPDWKSPKWPEGYWPDENLKFDEKVWEKTHKDFFGDLNKSIELAADPEIDLLRIIPHTESHTYLREFFILIEHNSYHLGKIVDIRKTLGNW